METLYKITGPSGEAVHGGSGSWNLPKRGKPGAWMPRIAHVVPCESGYHLLRVQDISSWLKIGVLWEVEACGELITETNKVVTGEARLVRKVGEITVRVLQEHAILSALRVLPIFEKARPGDDRPRKAIEAAQAVLRGDAAYAAARAARAADAAARAADAADAAYAAYAAYAAADAAHAAARAADAADAADAARAEAARAAYAAVYAAYVARAADAAYAADAARAEAARAAARNKQGEDLLMILRRTTTG